jgi:ADP-ribose pyrophosphatase YjhB (NUDIX family)
MPQSYKVYFSNRPVIFTQENLAPTSLGKGEVAIISKGKTDTINIETAISRGAKTIYVVSSDVEKAWQSFANQFEFVQAAGGLVINSEAEMLFIFRMGKWDLPKGKVEENEAIDSGALREVEEECSISALTLGKHLCDTWHTYMQKGDPMLKCTSWYMMSFEGNELPKPQLEEGITETRWIAANDLDGVYSNTYPSVIDVIEAHIGKA